MARPTPATSGRGEATGGIGAMRRTRPAAVRPPGRARATAVREDREGRAAAELGARSHGHSGDEGESWEGSPGLGEAKGEVGGGGESSVHRNLRGVPSRPWRPRAARRSSGGEWRGWGGVGELGELGAEVGAPRDDYL
jgi:hypothetical protein